MNLDVYNTHMELYPYIKDDYPVIENMYIAKDQYRGDGKACGYIIEDNKLFLPRGTSVTKIESICNVRANYINESDPYEKMNNHHSPLYDPKDEIQEESIKFLSGPEHQLALNIFMGGGKTYGAGYASTILNIKTIVITPNEGIKQQWISTYHKMLGYRPKDLINIAGSDIIEGIMDDSIEEADVYFVNHATLRNYILSNNGYSLHKLFKKIKVGIKIYDESHMEFNNILLIDFFTNTDRTWYLTATFDRSSKEESKCYERAFNSVIRYGEVQSLEKLVRHVVYHVVNINSRIDPKSRNELMGGYQGFTSIKYGKYAFLGDPNHTAYNAIIEIIKKLKDVEGKILIFVPMIDVVDEVTRKLKSDCPSKSVGAYHSRMDSDEKESSLKKDIIVSTVKSCGTGRDIPGLRSVICCEPIASKVLMKQVFGRLRPYAKDKDTYYFDIVDICIAPCNWYYRARHKVVATLAKKIIQLNIDK